MRQSKSTGSFGALLKSTVARASIASSESAAACDTYLHDAERPWPTTKDAYELIKDVGVGVRCATSLPSPAAPPATPTTPFSGLSAWKGVAAFTGTLKAACCDLVCRPLDCASLGPRVQKGLRCSRNTSLPCCF